MSETTDRLSAALADRYRIEHELGAGGMATVYLAEDLKHKRKVAVKVLRPELAAVLGAERFLQEIETTANLQHPHILPLFDSGGASGFLYYVMPFVDGESLRDKLNREKQLAVEEAVEITKAVASALDYAHRHDVIHRDIKPENILLQDGQPVVADFGIALAVRAAGGTRITETGLSLGTPHYMSPEQASGDRELDARSDVYSLACVTYEMLTGDPPHTGSTAQAVIASALTEVPRPMTARRPAVPPHVEAAVHQALEKLPADRISSAQRFADAVGNPDFKLPGVALPAGAGAANPWRGRAIAATAVAALAMAAAAWGWMRSAPTGGSVSRQVIALGSMRTTPDFPANWDLTLSPDGSMIVFADTAGGVDQLWLKRRDELDAVPLAGTIGGRAPFFSPDGEWIAFFVGETLRRIPLGGGAAITVTESARAGGSLAGAWADDGTIAFTARDNNLHVIHESGGTSRALFSAVGATGGIATELSALPEARGWLYAACAGGCTNPTVLVYDGRTGDVRQLLEGAVRAWFVSGHVVYVTPNGDVLAAPLDRRSLALTGPAIPLFDGVYVPFHAIGSRQFPVARMSVSTSGAIVYVAGTADRIRHQAVWVSRNGESTPVDSGWTMDDVSLNAALALSPDGSRLALSVPARHRAGGGDDIWVKELDGGPLTRVTAGEAAWRPKWTPDARSVTYVQGDDLYQRRGDGSGDTTLLLDLERPINEASWSSDEEWLILRLGGSLADPDRDIYAIRRGSDSVPIPISAEPGRQEVAPALSRDGRWIAYTSDESGQLEVYVRPFPDAASGRWAISTNGGFEPVWAHNGRELFYLETDALVVAEVTTEPEFRVLRRRTLFVTERRFIRGLVAHAYDVAPDDSRFLMIERKVEEGTASGLVLIENLLEELRGS